jgi:hypothetical protein
MRFAFNFLRNALHEIKHDDRNCLHMGIENSDLDTFIRDELVTKDRVLSANLPDQS